MPMEIQNAEAVMRGKCIYIDAIEYEVKIVKRYILYGTGDYEDPAEIRDDRDIECYYVFYEDLGVKECLHETIRKTEIDMLRKVIVATVAVIIIVCLSILIFGNNSNIGNDGDRELAEESVLMILRSRYYRGFVVEETIFFKETNEYEVFARSEDGEIKESIVIYIEDGRVFVRSTRTPDSK